jgi:Protein of unknown function (DUF4013)
LEAVLSSFTSQNLTVLFSFPFRGPNWKQKLMLGSVMSFLSLPLLFIPAVLIAGYNARILRQALNDQEPRLPEWDDWSQLLTDGLRLCAVYLIYTLPILVISIAAYALMVLSPALAAFLDGSGTQSGLSFTVFMFATILSGMGVLLVMLLSLVASMLLPVAVTHLVARDSFSAAFHWNE